MASRTVEETKTCEKTETQTVEAQPEEATVVLTLRKPKSTKKVEWTDDTVDNEHLNRKKSKCCCVYKKPHNFDESSSESDDDECEHCSGHAERKTHKEKS